MGNAARSTSDVTRRSRPSRQRASARIRRTRMPRRCSATDRSASDAARSASSCTSPSISIQARISAQSVAPPGTSPLFRGRQRRGRLARRPRGRGRNRASLAHWPGRGLRGVCGAVAPYCPHRTTVLGKGEPRTGGALRAARSVREGAHTVYGTTPCTSTLYSRPKRTSILSGGTSRTTTPMPKVLCWIHCSVLNRSVIL